MEQQIANDMETCGYTGEYRVQIKNPARPQLTYISELIIELLFRVQSCRQKTERHIEKHTEDEMDAEGL